MLRYYNIILLLQTIYIVCVEYAKYKLYISTKIQTFRNITNRLSKLNMLYTKILQWIINDSVYENHEMKKILEDFSDNVEYTDSDINYPVLLELLNNNENIKLDSLKPINSGTISLVYKGLLNNETPIIIKVLKNNIKSKLDESIKYFIFLSKLSKYIPYINECNLDKIVVNLNDKLLLQTNFEEEVKNIQIFNKNFKDNKNIIIPTVYDEYTLMNNNVIVMNYIKGSSVYSINENDKLSYLRILYEFMFECMFNYKVFHSDLHPGNILFIKENDEYKIGIIDYGLVEDYDDTVKQYVCLFFKKLVKGTDWELYEYIVNNLSEIVVDKNKQIIVDKNNVINDLLKVKEKYNILTSCIKAPDIYYVNNTLNKHNMTLHVKFAKIFLILSSMYSLMYMLQDDNNDEVLKECFKKYSETYVFTYLNFIE
jgi:predicted unusual protein kinase regulating ubiquinone biosynthesis (AarF/ABC1/UbiB family)